MGWKKYGSICDTGASQDECCCGNYCALASGQSAGGTGVCQEDAKRGGGRTPYAQRQIYRGGVGGGVRPPYGGGLPQGKRAGGSCKRKGMTVTSLNGVTAVVDCHGTWSGSRKSGWKCVPCDNLEGENGGRRRIGGGVPTPSPTYPTPQTHLIASATSGCRTCGVCHPNRCFKCDNGGHECDSGNASFIPKGSRSYARKRPSRGAIGRGVGRGGQGFGRGLSQSNLKVRYGGGFGG